MTEPTTPKQPQEGEPRQQVTFFFEKTAAFQTHHVDGVFGNLTPSGDVFLAFFVERSPIPKTLTCDIQPDGNLVNPRFTGKEGVFREMQTAFVMSPRVLADLARHINQLQQTLKRMQDAEQRSQPVG